jgi:protein-disulfide isomerase
MNASRAMLFGCLILMAACSKQEPPATPAAVSQPAQPAQPATPSGSMDPALPPELAERLVRSHSPIVGPAQAPVTIVEFLDPACEGCAAFSPVVKQIQLLYPTEVRVVVRFAAFHRGSDEAVRLLVAAQQQEKFEATLDALFERQQEWASHHAPDIEQAWTIAGAAGVDLARARHDARSAQAEQVLKQDGEDVVALRVERTPTFFVNGRSLSQFGPDGLLKLVREELQKAQVPAS